MPDWTKEPWSQGHTLLTAQTKQWRQDKWDANEAKERRTIFANFTAKDDGRGREFVAECKTEHDAHRIVACVNALAGFPNPEADVQALVEALEAIAALPDFKPNSDIGNRMNLKAAVGHAKAALGRLRREP